MTLILGSDFDRQPPGVTAFQNLRLVDQNGFFIAIDNIFNAGIEIVKGILGDWPCTFEKGIKPTNYIGDIFGSLGGDPDFGPGSLTEGKGYAPDGTPKIRERWLGDMHILRGRECLRPGGDEEVIALPGRYLSSCLQLGHVHNHTVITSNRPVSRSKDTLGIIPCISKGLSFFAADIAVGIEV